MTPRSQSQLLLVALLSLGVAAAAAPAAAAVVTSSSSAFFLAPQKSRRRHHSLRVKGAETTTADRRGPSPSSVLDYNYGQYTKGNDRSSGSATRGGGAAAASFKVAPTSLGIETYLTEQLLHSSAAQTRRMESNLEREMDAQLDALIELNSGGGGLSTGRGSATADGTASASSRTAPSSSSSERVLALPDDVLELRPLSFARSMSAGTTSRSARVGSIAAESAAAAAAAAAGAAAVPPSSAFVETGRQNRGKVSVPKTNREDKRMGNEKGNAPPASFSRSTSSILPEPVTKEVSAPAWLVIVPAAVAAAAAVGTQNTELVAQLFTNGMLADVVRSAAAEQLDCVVRESIASLDASTFVSHLDRIRNSVTSFDATSAFATSPILPLLDEATAIFDGAFKAAGDRVVDETNRLLPALESLRSSALEGFDRSEFSALAEHLRPQLESLQFTASESLKTARSVVTENFQPQLESLQKYASEGVDSIKQDLVEELLPQLGDIQSTAATGFENLRTAITEGVSPKIEALHSSAAEGFESVRSTISMAVGSARLPKPADFDFDGVRQSVQAQVEHIESALPENNDEFVVSVLSAMKNAVGHGIDSAKQIVTDSSVEDFSAVLPTVEIPTAVGQPEVVERSSSITAADPGLILGVTDALESVEVSSGGVDGKGTFTELQQILRSVSEGEPW